MLISLAPKSNSTKVFVIGLIERIVKSQKSAKVTANKRILLTNYLNFIWKKVHHKVRSTKSVLIFYFVFFNQFENLPLIRDHSNIAHAKNIKQGIIFVCDLDVLCHFLACALFQWSLTMCLKSDEVRKMCKSYHCRSFACSAPMKVNRWSVYFQICYRSKSDVKWKSWTKQTNSVERYFSTKKKLFSSTIYRIN